MTDKYMYNNDTQNYSSCRLQFVVETFGTNVMNSAMSPPSLAFRDNVSSLFLIKVDVDLKTLARLWSMSAKKMEFKPKTQRTCGTWLEYQSKFWFQSGLWISAYSIGNINTAKSIKKQQKTIS